MMGNVFGSVAREFNPLHDFDRFRFYRLSEITLEADQSKRLERLRSNGKFLFWTPKVMVRGFLVGAAMGGLAGMLSEDLESYDELYRSMAVGGCFAYQADLLQYWTRGAYHLFKGSNQI